MAGANIFYDDFAVVGSVPERDMAEAIANCLKMANAGGRVEVETTTQTVFLPSGEVITDEPVTIAKYYDSRGMLCGELVLPGDPFGLDASGGLRLAAAAAGITEFWLRDPSGRATAMITDMVPVDPDLFLAQFVYRTTSLDLYRDIVALTDGGANGQGRNGNDTFDLGTGPNVVLGRGGNDRLNKTAGGFVSFDGGDGVDTLSFQAGDGVVFPNAFTQQMVVNLATGTGLNPYGGRVSVRGVENVRGTSQADLITGNDRDNRLGDGIFDTGADVISARGGNDTVLVGSTDLARADGGTGYDTLVFSGSLDLQDAGVATRYTNFEKFLINPSISDYTPLALRGDGGANTFGSGDGADVLEGRGGNDLLDGGLNLNPNLTQGADVAVFSGARSRYKITVEGGSVIVTDRRDGSPDGTDILTRIEVLRFASGDVQVSSLGQNIGRAFFGNPGDDSFDGTALNDSLYGFDGNDSLDGAGGDNLLVGGRGNDIYRIGYGGTDRIVELAHQGTDTVVIGFNGNIQTFSIADLLHVENITGEDFRALTLTGNARNNEIRSFNGADTLSGGDGNDKLFGNFGADTLRGGDGNDQLTGGQGKDALFGGEGRDVFVFTNALDSGVTLATRDVITGFTSGEDRIDLTAIDPIVGGADNAFVFRGAAAITAIGQVRVFSTGNATFIDINLSGSAAPEMRIELAGIIAITEADFIL